MKSYTNKIKSWVFINPGQTTNRVYKRSVTQIK